MRPDERIASWTRDHPIFASVALVAASVTVAVVVASQLTGKPRETLQSAAITLVFAALIGGLVKILLDDFQRKREKRAEQARFVSAVLADLKSVYDRVERARVVIDAHKSAKTYGDEMHDLIDARVQLRNVGRALEARTSGITPERADDVCSAVRAMEQYLETLTDEFRAEYAAVSNAQMIHQARLAKLLESPHESTHLPRNEPWEKIERLERLSDFLAGTRYHKELVGPLDHATELLRQELRDLLAVKASPT